MPPAFWASAMICSAMVVLPQDSGPKISMTRPRGTPPTPSAASKEMLPVEITAMGTMGPLLPSRMMEPLPNCFSICEMAVSTARVFSVFSSAMSAAPSCRAGLFKPDGLCILLITRKIWSAKRHFRCSQRRFVDGVVYRFAGRRNSEIFRLSSYEGNHLASFREIRSRQLFQRQRGRIVVPVQL